MAVLSALFESGGTAVGEKPGRVRAVPVRDIAERYGAFVQKTTEFLGRFTGCGYEARKRSEGNSVVWQVTVYGKVSCSVRAGMLGLYWRPGNKA